MFQVTNFCGESGRSYHFKCVAISNADWLNQPGVAVYTAPDGRVIQIVEQEGRAKDLTGIWRWREARRFGAVQAFFRKSSDPLQRAQEIVDLVGGLHPVCGLAENENELEAVAA